MVIITPRPPRCRSLTWAALLAGLVIPAVAQPDATTPRQIIDDLIRQRDNPNAPASDAPAPDAKAGVSTATVDLNAAVVGTLPGSPMPRLRREGEFVVERPGQLLAIDSGGEWVFVFEPVKGQPDLRPMFVQKCQRLTSMQDTLGQRRDGDLAFTLTGQVHTYHGVNYLLPTAIAGTRKLPADVDTTPKDEPETETPDDFGLAPEDGSFETPATFDDAGAVDAGEPADAAGPGGAGGEDGGRSRSGPRGGGVPAPQELMQSILDQRDSPPERPDTSPVASPIDTDLNEALRGIKPDNEAQEKLRREGEYLVNRAGRLIRGIGGDVGGGGVGAASNVLFAFEADGMAPAAAEAPMLVMPCKLLELMEDTAVERGDQTVFIISGRVYTHRGANYLLPTTMRLEYDLGNLGE